MNTYPRTRRLAEWKYLVFCACGEKELNPLVGYSASHFSSVNYYPRPPKNTERIVNELSYYSCTLLFLFNAYLLITPTPLREPCPRITSIYIHPKEVNYDLTYWQLTCRLGLQDLPTGARSVIITNPITARLSWAFFCFWLFLKRQPTYKKWLICWH